MPQKGLEQKVKLTTWRRTASVSDGFKQHLHWAGLWYLHHRPDGGAEAPGAPRTLRAAQSQLHLGEPARLQYICVHPHHRTPHLPFLSITDPHQGLQHRTALAPSQEKEPQKTLRKQKTMLMKYAPVMAQTTMLYKRYTAEFKGITTWILKKKKKLHNRILSFKKLLCKNQFLAALIQFNMLQNIRMLIKTRSGGL